MYSRRKFHITVDATVGALTLLTCVFVELGLKDEIEPGHNSMYSWHGAFLCGKRLSIWAAVNHNRTTQGPDELFEALAINSKSGLWLDVDITIYNHYDVAELLPVALRIMGAILRVSNGDVVLLDDAYDDPGLVKKGDVITLNSVWQWTEEEEAALGVAHILAQLPGRPLSD